MAAMLLLLLLLFGLDILCLQQEWTFENFQCCFQFHGNANAFDLQFVITKRIVKSYDQYIQEQLEILTADQFQMRQA